MHGEVLASQGSVGRMGNGQDDGRGLSVADRKECGYFMADHWLFSSHRHWRGSI